MSSYNMIISTASKPALSTALTYALYSYKDESSQLKYQRSIVQFISTLLSNNFIRVFSLNNNSTVGFIQSSPLFGKLYEPILTAALNIFAT